MMIQLLLNKTTPHIQFLPMAKVDQSLLRIHEVLPKSNNIFERCNELCLCCR